MDELRGIVEDIAGRQPAAAERLVRQFEEHLETLDEMPRIGSPQDHRFGTEREYRRLPIHHFTNYGIFYEVAGSTVIIRSVRHGAMLRR